MVHPTTIIRPKKKPALLFTFWTCNELIAMKCFAIFERICWQFVVCDQNSLWERNLLIINHNPNVLFPISSPWSPAVFLESLGSQILWSWSQWHYKSISYTSNLIFNMYKDTNLQSDIHGMNMHDHILYLWILWNLKIFSH